MRRIIAAILALAALMGFSAVFSPAAFADGDPASDVLVFDQVFDPPDSGISASDRAQLFALVKAVNDGGYKLRVAIINSSADLGTATQLWQDPKDYAIYLDKELSLQFKGTLLVVMPQGYGLLDPVPTKDIPKGDITAMSGLNAPGSALAEGTYQVVERLAADNGISVPKRFSVAASSAASGGGSSSTALIGFIVGLVVLVGVWVMSIRLRPVRLARAKVAA